MNKKIIISVIFAILGVWAVYSLSNNNSFGGVPQVPSYTTASSTATTIGDDISKMVLQQKGGRGYAILCNNNGGTTKAYLFFQTTAVVATSSADVLLGAGSCYEIDNDNLYTGEVWAMQENATTTARLLVTEFIGY